MESIILEKLEEAQGQFLSGESLAKATGVTRANIWKIMQKLKEKGYDIESVKRYGYRLTSINNNLSRYQILKQCHHLKDCIIYDSLTSTNDIAKELYERVKQGDILIISNQQTGGKGRRGRSFYSPSHTGIYCSILIETDLPTQDGQLITITTALAAREAILKCYGIEVDIKWLNDLVSKAKKKLGGILTEGALSLEMNSYQYLVVGLGLNVFKDENLPKELEPIVESLEGLGAKNIDRNELVIAFVNEFYHLLAAIATSKVQIINAYKKASNVLGKQITVSTKPNQTFNAIDIDIQGQLIVKDDAGTIHALNSGDVSIREVQ